MRRVLIGACLAATLLGALPSAASAFAPDLRGTWTVTLSASRTGQPSTTQIWRISNATLSQGTFGGNTSAADTGRPLGTLTLTAARPSGKRFSAVTRGSGIGQQTFGGTIDDQCTTASGSWQATVSGSSDSGTWTAALPASARGCPGATATATPTFGKTEVVEPVSGTVLVRRPGKDKFERVTKGTAVPDKSELDTRKGVARVTAAKDAAGTTISAEVSKGLAVVDQQGALTQLKLSQKLTGCAGSRGSANPAAKKPKKRAVFVKTKDNFQTRGNHAAGTVRGTQWTTTDTCTSTTIQVAEGIVSVLDLVKRVTVLVTAPNSYTARRAG